MSLYLEMNKDQHWNSFHKCFILFFSKRHLSWTNLFWWWPYKMRDFTFEDLINHITQQNLVTSLNQSCMHCRKLIYLTIRRCIARKLCTKYIPSLHQSPFKQQTFRLFSDKKTFLYLTLYRTFLCIRCCSSPLLIIRWRTLWMACSGYFCSATRRDAFIHNVIKYTIWNA